MLKVMGGVYVLVEQEDRCVMTSDRYVRVSKYIWSVDKHVKSVLGQLEGFIIAKWALSSSCRA